MCVGVVALFASSSAFAQDADYPLSFDREQAYTHASRRLQSVTMSGSEDGNRTLEVPTSTVYNSLSRVFTARAGETVSVSFGYSGTWMHGYVYLDRGCDGAFAATLNDDGSIPEGSDIMAFSYAEPVLNSGNGFNSNGEQVANQNVLNPPAFTIPSDLAPGYYLMRFKVDWASIDPAGRTEDGNGILKNGGAVCDVRLNVHGDYSNISVDSENGSVLAVEGSSLDGVRHPFGSALAVRLVPDEGYMCDALVIRHGYNLQGDSLVHGVAQYRDEVVPGFSVVDNMYEIPAEYIDGDVLIEPRFIRVQGAAVAEYGLSFPEDTEIVSLESGVTGLRLSSVLGYPKTIVVPSDAATVYNNLAPMEFPITRGDSFDKIDVSGGDSLHCYMYIDYNNDGRFSVVLNENGTPSSSGELVSYSCLNGRNSHGEEVVPSEACGMLPLFGIPEKLPCGVYRARFKSDLNNADAAGSPDIVENGGMIIDFLVNVHNSEHSLKSFCKNGDVYYGEGAHATVLTPFETLRLSTSGFAAGYEMSEFRVRHGHNLDGPQYIHGNRQWSEYRPPMRSILVMPRDSVNGDVEVYVDYVPTDSAEYILVFSDEFDAPDGSQPDEAKWIRCQRMGATWNRWCSDSEEVVYIEDGNLVTRAIPNPDTASDNVPMITGGIKSMGKFGFTYGRVECRLLTNPWTGNFPALWMMPENQSAGWPDCGEIDIFETIDAQERAWHTVHSNWTWDLGYKNNPKSSYDEAVPLDRYHTYALEWDESTLIWFVDGKEVARYAKSSDSYAMENGQWPFDKHFHLILNQSVGNGSWAANADESHTYETLFDWVRVYQKRGMKNTLGTVGIEAVCAASNVDVDVVPGGILLSSSAPVRVTVCDLQGRTLFGGDVCGSVSLSLACGLYVINGDKVLVR